MVEEAGVFSAADATVAESAGADPESPPRCFDDREVDLLCEAWFADDDLEEDAAAAAAGQAAGEAAAGDPAPAPEPARNAEYTAAAGVEEVRHGVNRAVALAATVQADGKTSAAKAAKKFKKAYDRTKANRPEAALEDLDELFKQAAHDVGDFYTLGSHLASFWNHVYMDQDPLDKNRKFPASVPLDSPQRWYHPGSLDVFIYGIVCWLNEATEKFKDEFPDQGALLSAPNYDDATFFSKAHKACCEVQKRSKKSGKGVEQGGADGFTLGELQDAICDESLACSEFSPSGLQRLVNVYAGMVGELRSEDALVLRTAAYEFYSCEEVPADQANPDVLIASTFWRWRMWDPIAGGFLGKTLTRSNKRGKFNWARSNDGCCTSCDPDAMCAWQFFKDGKWSMVRGKVPNPLTNRVRLRACSEILCPHRAMAKYFLLRPCPLAHDFMWLQLSPGVETNTDALQPFTLETDGEGDWLERDHSIEWYSSKKMGHEAIKAMPAEALHKLVAKGRKISYHTFKKATQQNLHRLGYDGVTRRGHGGHTSEAANEKYLCVDDAQRQEVGKAIFRGVKPPTLAESQAAAKTAELHAKLDKVESMLKLQADQNAKLLSLDGVRTPALQDPSPSVSSAMPISSAISPP